MIVPYLFSIVVSLATETGTPPSPTPTAPAQPGCTALDLRTSTFASIPIRNQGPGPICYASATASLIDALRIQSGASTTPFIPTSDEHLAILTDIARARTPGGSGGGAICEAWDIARSRHACMSRAFPPGFGIAEAQRLSATLSFLANPPPKGAAPLSERVLATLRGSCFPPNSLVVSPAIEELARSVSTVAFGELVLADACGTLDRFYLPIDPACRQNAAFDSPDSVRGALLGAQDSANGLPIGITYCHAVLSGGPDTRELVWPGPANLPRHSPACREHASLLIGRREHEGRCQVLIRNSTGPVCDSRYHSSWTCEGGDIWVDLDALAANTFTVSELVNSTSSN